MLTRKDFIAAAEWIGANLEGDQLEGAFKFARWFLATQNPRFDVARFSARVAVVASGGVVIVNDNGDTSNNPDALDPRSREDA